MKRIAILLAFATCTVMLSAKPSRADVEFSTTPTTCKVDLKASAETFTFHNYQVNLIDYAVIAPSIDLVDAGIAILGKVYTPKPLQVKILKGWLNRQNLPPSVMGLNAAVNYKQIQNTTALHRC